MEASNMHDTLPKLAKRKFPNVARGELKIAQLNLGYKCNQACLHCHVNAGPTRVELMSEETTQQVLDFIDRSVIETVDLTGGAPELNPHFRKLVSELRSRKITTIDRCNLTILSEPGQEDLAEFLASQKVQIVASLPCYIEDNVNAQRGDGVFQKSIIGIQKLNALGYGQKNSGLELNLVFNPQGAALPAPQEILERDYRDHLGNQFGITFNALFTITNMPIKRFGSTLVSKGEFDGYMDLLQSAYQESNLESLMCRNLISIDHQGYVYDCDFNQMLGLPLGESSSKIHISELNDKSLVNQTIKTLGHCFGCTAGQGSSCGGALQ